MNEDNSPSMPAGGLRPLGGTKINIGGGDDIVDNAPSMADYDAVEISDDAKNSSKSIDIIDQSPEAEDLINGSPADTAASSSADEAPAEVTPSPEPGIDNANIEPVENVAPVDNNIEQPETEPARANDSGEIKIDSEHAYEEGNEEFFRTMREKLSTLRRERNECIVAADKKEDELTLIERYNSQYEIAGAFDKVETERTESLRDEIREARKQAEAKDRAVRAILKTIRTL